MAIEVSKLIRKIRLKAMDFDEIKYSDYQIINAINLAQQMHIMFVAITFAIDKSVKFNLVSADLFSYERTLCISSLCYEGRNNKG